MARNQTSIASTTKPLFGLFMLATRKPSPSERSIHATPSMERKPSPVAWQKTATLSSSRRPCLTDLVNLMEIDAPDPSEPFGPVIYAYTRSQAVADGEQLEVTKTAQEAGIRFPVFLTRAVYEAYVAVPPGVSGQDEAGRLWDLLWLLRFAILRSRPGCDRLPFALYVRNDNRTPKLVELIAACGPFDIDDPSPAITVMLPGED